MIKVIIEDGVETPQYKSAGASGFDVQAIKLIAVYKSDSPIEEERLEILKQNFIERGFIKLRAFERALFGTGIVVADMSFDKEIQVRSRSGFALKRGFIVSNSPGTVDSDFRGEIGIILTNNTPFLNKIDRLERIAQLVIADVCLEKRIEVVTEKTITERGEQGFGSTGTK